METSNNMIQSIIKFFNTYKDPVLILDKDFIISHVNSKGKDLFPVLNDNEFRRNFWDILSQYTQLSSNEYNYNEIHETKKMEIYFQTMDKWFEMAFNELEGFGYLITLIDITEKIHAKQKYNIDIDEYREFMEEAFDVLYQIDPISNKLHSINDKRVNTSWDITNLWESFINTHPDDLEYVKEKAQKEMYNKRAFYLDYRILDKNNEYIWIRSRTIPIKDDNGNIIKWIGVANDITLEMESELDLIKKEKEYLELLNSTTIGFYIKDFKKKEIHISETWKRKLGLDSIDSKGLYIDPHKLIHPEDKEELKKFFQEKIINKIEKYSTEYRIKINKYKYIWVLVQARIIYDEEGNPLKEFGTHIDITDRKSAIKALIESEIKANQLVVKLKRADELKDNFISTLAHELRNPLATMSMGLSLLDQIESGSEVDINTREIIKRQTNQLIKLVDDLLHTSRIITNKMELIREDLEINNLILELVEEYKILFDEKEIQLQVKYFNEPIYTHGDPLRIKQAIGNLLINALKFTNKGGVVHIIIDKDNKNNMLIEVIDNGIGMEPELLPKLFEPFIQLDNSLTRTTSGLGLGLSIAKGIVDLHNGSIDVWSEGICKGTKFTIIFPHL